MDTDIDRHKKLQSNYRTSWLHCSRLTGKLHLNTFSILYRDNCNSAHFPDDCNPDYSIQTPPVDIDILSDEVSIA